MKRLVLCLALMVLLVAPGCRTVTSDIVESIEVLRDNTHSLSQDYDSLLQRAVAPAGPVGETLEQARQREAAWKSHVQHEQALMRANNTLADKVLEWAKVEAQDEPAADTGKGD